MDFGLKFHGVMSLPRDCVVGGFMILTGVAVIRDCVLGGFMILIGVAVIT